VVNRVLAHELQLPAVVAPIKAQLARRQRDAELVRLGVLEFALDEDLLVIGRAIALVVIQPIELIPGRAVINVDGRAYIFSA